MIRFPHAFLAALMVTLLMSTVVRSYGDNTPNNDGGATDVHMDGTGPLIGG